MLTHCRSSPTVTRENVTGRFYRRVVIAFSPSPQVGGRAMSIMEDHRVCPHDRVACTCIGTGVCPPSRHRAPAARAGGGTRVRQDVRVSAVDGRAGAVRAPPGVGAFRGAAQVPGCPHKTGPVRRGHNLCDVRRTCAACAEPVRRRARNPGGGVRGIRAARGTGDIARPAVSAPRPPAPAPPRAPGSRRRAPWPATPHPRPRRTRSCRPTPPAPPRRRGRTRWSPRPRPRCTS